MSKTTRFLTFLLTTLLAASVFAQGAAAVRELVPSTAPAGARVLVTGRGLADPAIAVSFAPGANAAVVTRSERFVEVVVPPNAVSGNVRVTLGTTLLKELPFTLAGDPKYVVTTLAGGPRSQNEPLKHPWGAAVVLPGGSIAVADEQHHQIKLVSPAGAVSLLAGEGKHGDADGTGAAASFKSPRGIAFDAARNVLYVSDSDNNAIRRVTLDGVVSTIARGDFKDPYGLAVGADGAIYVADSMNDRIQRVTVDGAVTTFATGFNTPRGIVAVGSDFYVADTKNNAIRKISNGQVTTVVSFPASGEDGNDDGVDGNPHVLHHPTGIGVDEAGYLIVSDSLNDFIRRIDPHTGVMTILAGSGRHGWADGDAATAQFKDPVGLTVAGAIYVADEDNDALRRLCPEVRVTGLDVPVGRLVAGTEVRLFGTGFIPGATSVAFDGVVATDVTWITSTTILVKLPQAITGGSVAVTVSSCGGSAGPATFVVDNTPPTLTITNNGAPLPDGSLFKVPVVPVLTATDDFDPNPTVTATLNAVPFVSGTTVTADGVYTLIGTAEDAAGNRKSETVHFTIDATPPVVEVLEGTTAFPAGFWFKRPVVIDVKVTDLTTVTTDVRIDGQLYVLQQPYAIEGTHQLTVRAVDALGNETPVGPIAFTIDLTPPHLTFTSHTNGQTVTLRDVTIVGGSDDAVTVKVNGNDAVVDPAAKTFTIALSLIEGENTITVTGTDRAGNSGEATLELVLDTRAPELTVAAVDACTRADSLAVHGTVSDPHIDKVVVTIDGVATTATLDGSSWTATVPLGAEGRKSIVVEASDASGHVATQSAALVVDRTKPAIALTESGAPFDATTVARPVALFFRATDADADVAATATLDGTPYTLGTQISSETTHTIRITARDCAGNDALREQTFLVDLTPPRFLSFTPASGAKVAQVPSALSGTVDPDAVEVRLADGSVRVPAQNGAFALDPHFANGVNELSLEVVDRAGHIGRAIYTLGIKTTDPLIDVIEGGASLVDGTVYTRGVRPEVRVFEEGVTFTATLDDAPFTNGTEVSANGPHTIRATATDPAYGTSRSITRHFTIDRSGPVVTITSPADGANIDAPATDVRVTATDAIAITVNGIAADKQQDGSWLAPAVPLEIGENLLVANGRDAAGNNGSDSAEVTRGNAGPAMVLTFPPDPYLTNRPHIDVTGRVLRPNSTVAVTVPPAQAVSVAVDPAGVFRLTGAVLTEGESVIVATASEGGKSVSVSARVTADFTPPRVRLLESGQPFADGATFATQAVVSGDASDKGQPVDYVLAIDGNNVASSTSITAAGGHTAVITARDAAGNEARLERTFTIGATAGGGCSLSAFDPADGSTITADKVELVGRSGGAAGVKVNGIAAKMSSGSFSATVELPREGANSVTIVCTDADGNPTGTPETITFVRVTEQPEVTIETPVENYVTHDGTIIVAGTLGNGAVSVDLNGKPATINGSLWTATDVRLADGLNMLVARAKNAAGRTATASRRVTYIEDPPAIAISAPIQGFVTGQPSTDVSGTYSNVDPASLAIAGLAGAIQATPWSDTTGKFVAHSVPLTSAENTIAVTGSSRTGRTARAEVTVRYSSTAPVLTITDPEDNSYFGASEGETFRVSGTFTAVEGSSVDVNGVAATVDQTAKTFVADVPFSTLAGNLTPVIARLTEPDGDGAFDSIRVYRLATAAKVIETFPAADAVEVDPGVVALVLFSSPMDRTSTVAAFRLENSSGTALNGKVYLDKDVLSFAPAAPLTAGERYTIKISTDAKDLAGQNLDAAVASSFIAATTAPSTPPALTTPSGRICAQTVDVAGTATPGARVRIDYGTIFFTTTASASGAFTYKVPLSGQQGFQIIRVRTMGADGSLSPFAELKLEVDCSGPHVVSASYDRNVNRLTILFSRDVNPSTLAGNLQLLEGTRTLGGTTSVNGATVVLTPEEDLTAKTFTLKVTTGVEDTQGHKLEFPHTQLFSLGDDEPQPGNGGGYITGEVYDATTGRPLANAEITIEVPVSAFARGVRVTANANVSTQAVTMPTDAHGRYGDLFPEGAHTIKASANGYTTVWRQIIVPAGAGVIPIDIRLTRRGDTQTAASGAMTLTHGGTNAVARKAELAIPAGAVASGTQVTLTSAGAQSLAGLLPLGWSPLASAEVVATNSVAGKLTFDVPQAQITNASQTLTAVRYDDARDEWNVLVPAVNIAGDKASFDITSAGAYALVYPDKRAGLTVPAQPHAGAPLQGVSDPCATGTCPAMVATSFPLDPEVVLPTGSTVASLNIDGADAQIFPSGTAVQAYIDEELHLADGGRELDPPFATDLLLYRDLTGDAANATFNLAPSPHAAEVLLEVGFDHIRVLPYPGRLDRGTLVGPEGGRVPGDDTVSVEIPTGAAQDALRATASSIVDLDAFGTIPGFTIVGGLQLTLQRATQPAPGDIDGDGVTDAVAPVELSRPARATFTTDTPATQLILAEVIDQTPFGNRILRLASEMTQLDGGRWTTKTIDRERLPIDGIVHEGRYLLLAANAPIAFAKGGVRLATGVAVADARVTTPLLGVADLSRLTGLFTLPVPATPAAPFTLIPRTVALGDGTTYVHPSAPAPNEAVNVGDLQMVAQPPHVASTIPAPNATNVALSTSVEATFTPGIDPSSVDATSVMVVDTTSNTIVAGTVAAVGNLGIRWTLPAGEALRASTRYTVALAPTIRGTNGTPLDRAYTFSFTTAEVLTNGELHPERVRITIPDANGVSKITGTAGALKTGWIAIPVRRGNDFITKYSATAANDGSFAITIGDTPRDRVAITDDIDLRVLNNNGALAAIIPLTPFVSEDGRAFVAPAGQTVTFTSADGIAVTVPAGAFDRNTRVDVVPVTAAAFSAVPRISDEFNLVAAVSLQFEGRANRPLELVLPAPNANFSRPHFLGQLGLSSRGPRIMAVDLLYPSGNGAFTTVRPASGSNVRTIRVGSNNATGYQSNDPKDLLQLVIEAGQYVAMDMKDIGNSNGTVWALMDTGNTVNELFWDTLYSMYVGYRYITEGRGRVAFPVPAGLNFTVTSVDPATSLINYEQPYAAIPAGDPFTGIVIATPSTDFGGPYPVYATPTRVETVEAPPAGSSIEGTRDVQLALDTTGNLTISGSGSMTAATHVSALHVRSGEVRGPWSLPISFTNVEAGDRIVLMIEEDNVDPMASVSVVFNEPIDVGGASTVEEVSDALKELIRLEQITSPGSPGINISKYGLLRLDSSGRRVTMYLPSPLASGQDFQLILSENIQDRSGNGLKLAQVGTAGSGGTVTPTGPLPQPINLRFSTRKPAGVLSAFDLRQRVGADYGQIREIAKYDNLMFVAALDGGILAYDLSNPAALNDMNSSKPVPIGVAPGRDSDASTPITNYWSVFVDHHGRVLTTGTTNMFGAMRTFRVEDFINAQTDPNDCLPTITYTVCKQTGGAIVSQLPGTAYGVGISSAVVAADRVEAIPRKAAYAIGDEAPENFTRDTIVSTYGDGAPDDTIGGGLWRFNLKVPASTAKYRLQRITVENVTRGLRWSADAKATDDGPTIGSAGFTDVIAGEGDELRVIRNRTTHAVVTLFGYGIGIFDVNAIESNELPQWSGATERPREQVALRANASGNPTTSDPASIGDLAYSPQSAMLELPDGSIRVYTLDSRKGVVEFSFVPPGAPQLSGQILLTDTDPRFAALKSAVLGVQPDAFARYNSIATYTNPDTKKSYVLVPALHFGLIAIEAGAVPLNADSFADVVWMPGGAYAVRVLDHMNLAVVVDGSGYAHLIDLSRIDERIVNGTATTGLFPTAAASIAANQPDPRVLWSSTDPVASGGGFIPPIVDSDTGIMISADLLGRRMRASSVIDPRLRVVADFGDSHLKEISSVVPLGITPPAGTPFVAANGSLAAFRVEATLPASLGGTGELPFALESERVADAAMPQTPDGMPRAHYRTTMAGGNPDPRASTDFKLKSALPIATIPALKYQRGANRWISPWVVTLADARASKSYTGATLAEKVAAGCEQCDRPSWLPNDALELWSAGRTLHMRPNATGLGAFDFLTQNQRLTTRIGTVMADLSRPADDVLAAQNPAPMGADNEDVVQLHDGEIETTAVDLSFASRGIDFVLDRTYNSSTFHLGPLGRNIDSNLFARIRVLPNGSVDYFDGSGRRDRFTSAGNGSYTPPPGVFLDASRRPDGTFVIVYPDRKTLLFDALGRVVEVTDRNRTKSDGSDGNAFRFAYRGDGLLDSVIDPLGRRVTLTYYDNDLLHTVTDFDNRTVTYAYDPAGRLTDISSPDPGSALSAQQTTTYTWTAAPSAGDLEQVVYLGSQLTSLSDGLNRTVFSVGYQGSDMPWAAAKLTRGLGTWQITPGEPELTVTDPAGRTWTYTHDAFGNVTQSSGPAIAGANTTVFGYDAQQRLTSITRPMGDEVIYGYAGGGEGQHRNQGNVTSITEKARPGSPEAVANIVRTTSIGYGTANLPTSLALPDGSSTAVLRDSRGNPKTLTDSSGQVTITEYDEHGLIKKSVDPRSGESQYGYHPDQKAAYLHTVTNAAGTITIEVDARGNETSVTDASGQTTTYTVNKLDQIESETAGASKMTMSYDAAGKIATRNVVTGVDAAGNPIYRTTNFSFDAQGRMTSRNDNGQQITFGYDPKGNLTSLTRAGQPSVTFGYDALDRFTSRTVGSRTTTYGYDANGTTTSITNSRGKTTTFRLSGFGDTAGQVNPSGTFTNTVYDANGLPVDMKLLQKSGTKTFVQQWSKRRYDAFGRVVEQTAKLFSGTLELPDDGSEPAGATDVVTRFVYDDDHQKTTIIDPRGKQTIEERDDLGRVVRLTDAMGNTLETEWAANGNKQAETLTEVGPGGARHVTRTVHEYDANDRLVSMTRFAEGAAPIAVHYEYDEQGNVIAETDPDGNTKHFKYDTRRRKIEEQSAERGVTKYEYDDADRPRRVTDANNRVTEFAYDDDGHLVSQTRLADQAKWTFTYDENGNRKSITDPNGTTVTLVYDDYDRVIAKDIVKGPGVAGPSHIDITLDALGRQIATDTDEGVHETFTWDSLGRQTSESIRIGSGPTRTVTRAYDAAANLTALTYPSGLQVTQDIDDLDRVSAIRDAASQSPIVAYTDVGGSLSTRSMRNGITESWSYDPQRRLAGIMSQLTGATVRNVQYERSLAGDKRSVVRPDLQYRSAYGYDGNHWMTNEDLRIPLEGENPPAAVSRSYDLDDVLNFRSIARSVQMPGGTVTTSATTLINGREQYATFDNEPLDYDANGNLKSRATASMQYDFENRLRKVTLANGTDVEMLYDGDGRKVQQKVDGTTTQYVLSGATVLEEYVDGTLAARYVHGRGVDEIVRAEIGEQTVYPLQDELGTVERLTDTNGNTLERYEYEGYGTFRILDGNGATRGTSTLGWKWLFQGRELQPLVGTYDFRARTLWPDLGRFGQEDPIRAHPGLSPYEAFLGSPVNLTDPSGLYEEDTHHYLTVFIGRGAGFVAQRADLVGFETGHLDYDERDAMYGHVGPYDDLPLPTPNTANYKKYHFVTEEHLEEMRIQAYNRPGDLRRAGEYFHALEDTFSHQSNDHHRDFSAQYKDFRYMGHAGEGHEPDWTWGHRAGLAMQMAQEVYDRMLAYCVTYTIVMPNKQCSYLPWTQLEPTIKQFVEFKPALFFMESYGGVVEVPSVADYQPKVSILDTLLPSVPGEYTLRDYEKAPRIKGLLDYRQREKLKAQAAARQHAMAMKNWDKR